MSQDILTEFEDYVKKLTTAISKEIFLEKLESLFHDYGEVYKDVKSTADEMYSSSNKFHNGITEANQVLDCITQESNDSLKKIADDILHLEMQTDLLFDEMGKKNEKWKQKFIEDLDSYINGYKDDIAKVIDSGCNQISDKFRDVITYEQVQHFMQTLEESTRESKEMVRFINDGYKNEAKKSIQSIISENRVAQDKVNASIEEHIEKFIHDLDGTANSAQMSIDDKISKFTEATKNQMMLFTKHFTTLLKDERKEREETLQKQIELIKQIGPSDDKMNLLNERVTCLNEVVNELKESDKKYIMVLINSVKDFKQEQIEHEKRRLENEILTEKRAEHLSWRIYMTFTNSLNIILFALLIFFQKPWEVFGIHKSILIASSFIGTFLFVNRLRSVISHAIVKRKSKKDSIYSK